MSGRDYDDDRGDPRKSLKREREYDDDRGGRGDRGRDDRRDERRDIRDFSHDTRDRPRDDGGHHRRNDEGRSDGYGGGRGGRGGYDDRRGSSDGRGGRGGASGGFGGGRPRNDLVPEVGSMVNLETNLFVFETAGSTELGAEFNFKYDIRFTEISAASGEAISAPAAALPVPDGDKPITMYQRRRLFWNHVSEKLKAFGVSTCILDGSMLFTSAKIVNAETGAPLDELELTITDSLDPRRAARSGPATTADIAAVQTYKVMIRPAGEIGMTDVEREHISNLRLDRSLLSKLRELKASGVASAKSDGSKWVKIGNMFVDLAAPSGSVKSLQTMNRCTIKFYPSYRVVVKKQIVGPEAVCIQRRYKPIMQESVGEYMRTKCRKPAEELLNVVVVTYTYGVPRSYTILEVLTDEDASSSCFEYKGETISLEQYMKKRYDVTLKREDARQPLLLATQANVRGGGKKRGKPTARPVKLIPAYCFICDLSAFKADPMLKKDMPRQLGMDPHTREEAHREMAERLRVAMGALSVTKSTIPARYIGMGQLDVFGSSSRADVDAMTGKYMLRGARMDPALWRLARIVILHGNRDRHDTVDAFMKHFQAKARDKGLSLPRYETLAVRPDDSEDRIVRALDGTIPLDVPALSVLLIVELPRGNEDKWHALVKDWEIRRMGAVHTQCYKQSTTAKDDRAFSGAVDKIVTQINAKLGGHLVEHPSLLVDIGKLLATPDDVYLIAGVAHIRNIVAMTFATDYTCTSFGTVFAKMEDNTKAYPVNVLLSYARSFFERMGVMSPTVVVLYRSGLNPGQEQRVLASEQPKLHEYLQLVAADSKTSRNPKSAVHYVVVNKDPDTRAAMVSAYGPSINPLPGTCVDESLFGGRNKFLLWSTSAPRGASSKAVEYHVHTIPSRETNIKAIEDISTRLSVLYHNWEGSIATPAPFKLAERAAERMSDHVLRQGYTSDEIVEKFAQWSAYADRAGLFQL